MPYGDAGPGLRAGSGHARWHRAGCGGAGDDAARGDQGDPARGSPTWRVAVRAHGAGHARDASRGGVPGTGAPHPAGIRGCGKGDARHPDRGTGPATAGLFAVDANRAGARRVPAVDPGAPGGAAAADDACGARTDGPGRDRRTGPGPRAAAAPAPSGATDAGTVYRPPRRGRR
ncbi:hypothetical protein D3C87_1290140 [compost metagenome]